MCNRTAYYEWPEELKIAIAEAVQEAVSWQRKRVEDEVIKAQTAIKNEGHEIIELNPEQQALFSVAVKPQHDDAREIFGNKMFKLLENPNQES